MSYRLRAKAEEDIIGIFLTGVEQFGRYQADRYHDRLERVFQFLADHPMAARERSEITPAVRMFPVGAHLVVYQLEDSGDVDILRVRHGHEDWQVDRY